MLSCCRIGKKGFHPFHAGTALHVNTGRIKTRVRKIVHPAVISCRLGKIGEVIPIDFSPFSAATPTPQFSPTPTNTFEPTYTPQPETPLPTNTPTPYIP